MRSLNLPLLRIGLNALNADDKRDIKVIHAECFIKAVLSGEPEPAGHTPTASGS